MATLLAGRGFVLRMKELFACLVIFSSLVASAKCADAPVRLSADVNILVSTYSAPKNLAPVRVDGHYNNGIGTSNAASQGIILGSFLQDIPLLRPGEILEAIPGMVVTQHSGDGKANQYFLRGYNLDHGTDFATSVDGVPINMPSNAHGQGYSDLNFLIPELVQQIDYRKGTYYAENGDFSAAGSADILYRKALPAPILNLTLGSFGYRRVLLAGSTPVSLPAWTGADSGNTSAAGPLLLGAVEVMSENGPWRLPEDMHKFNGLARLSDVDDTRGWTIDLNAYDAHWDSTDQVPLSLIQSGALCRFCALDTSDGGYSGREILSVEWHTQDANGYTRLSAYAEHYRLQLFSDFTYFELRPDTGDQFEQAESRNLVGTKIAQGWTGSLFGHDSTTEAGFQLRHDHIDVGLFNTEDRIPFQTVNDNRINETEAAVYLENTTIWSDWFRSQIGVRQDDIHLGLTELNIPQNTGDGSGSRTSPKLALVFGPWAKTEFFLDAGNGFHSNDARGVIYRVDPTTGGPSTPVPALVGAFGQEIGVRTEIVSGLQSSLSLWRLNSESELVFDADSAVGSTTPNGASRRYGVEWSNHYVLNDWLLADVDLAYTHARFANENDNGELGNHIPNAVPKVGSIGLTVHDVDDWSGDIKLRYIGRYPLSQDNTLVGSSAIVTNVRIGRTLTPLVSLSLDVLNLFDRRYYDIEYQQDYRASLASASVPSGVTVHPGEPRELRLTLDIKL